ncbi:endonuclease/exonuclease/phosphatase family protein [Pseudooctadecabacter jejudonensis]|uniref:Endonuclease/exonuclease/phosphatase domain-containing protein n=1 Tax=Pseudooctadecabacter jejudonensis TaxID=1391910 RepID=A0A1Y5SJ87_9RHOB|nr:endonuclease/exonuclease/phosphatase family protein [Pseudooctadecabacter jejudonensis]SLN38912.1 hypothetical protein PSJ8397_01928 [Pseudooctadecabacter jejudonensis]
MTPLLYIIVTSVSAALLGLTLIPFLRVHHGALRGPEFVRLQLLISAVGLMGFVLIWDAAWSPVALVLLLATVVINAVFMLKFTPLWAKQSQTAGADLQARTNRHLTLLTANVKMSNRSYDAVLEMAANEPADILALIEPDADWIAAMGPLRDRFAHYIEHPLDTGYGMAIYSDLPLSDTELTDLVVKGVPSIQTTATLKSGDQVRLFFIHPEPPTATDPTKGRDSEIMLAGLKAKDHPLPSIIAGDLNDVAWSHTTRKFQRITGLLDPRVGRGFFNTFNAFYPIFRWPLDHLFHDDRFRFVAMQRLRKINSDHFPLTVTLALADTPAGVTPDAVMGEETMAQDMIRKEQAKDRTAIGSDWEKDAET